MIDLAARFTILALLAVCFALLRKKAIDTMASGGIKGSTTRLRPGGTGSGFGSSRISGHNHDHFSFAAGVLGHSGRGRRHLVPCSSLADSAQPPRTPVELRNRSVSTFKGSRDCFELYLVRNGHLCSRCWHNGGPARVCSACCTWWSDLPNSGRIATTQCAGHSAASMTLAWRRRAHLQQSEMPPNKTLQRTRPLASASARAAEFQPLGVS